MRDFADADVPKLNRAARILTEIWHEDGRSWALGYAIGDYARAALKVIELIPQHSQDKL